MWECFDDPAVKGCILTAQLTKLRVEKKKKKVPWLHFKTRPCCKLCTFIKKKKKRQKNTTTWRVKLYTYEVICNPLISQEPVFHFSPQNSMRVCRSRQRGDRAAVSHASGLFYCFNTWNNQLLFLCATSQFWNRLITLPRFFQCLHLTAQTDYFTAVTTRYF